MQHILILILCLITTGIGCAITSQQARQRGVEETYVNSTVALRQSCYFGDLYDENELFLLLPQAFDTTSHITDLRGQPIYPRNQQGIVPAGTVFVVKRIEWPDSLHQYNRLLTTPRYHAWVYLQPLEPLLYISNHKRDFIVLLPYDTEHDTGFHTTYQQLFGNPNVVNAWLAQRKPTVRVAIQYKTPIPGMMLDELTASMGEPHKLIKSTQYVDDIWVAQYSKQHVWLKNGFVTSVQTLDIY